MHLKRQKVPKSWPTPRKGTTFVVGARFNPEGGIPLLIILRDLLKVAQNRREVKRALYAKHILLNNKIAKEERNPALLFDTVTIIPSGKTYRIEISSNGKFEAVEIKKSEAGKKISKITNKRIIKGKKTQLNLLDGRNILSDIKCKVNDSVVLDFETGKIEKCVPLKENAQVTIFGGKHSGEKGTIRELIPERKLAKVEIGGDVKEILIKQMIATE
jgi:small subunit ribosomal protein S4e